MGIISFPYIGILTDEMDPETGDRKVSAGEYADGFDLLVTSGVVPGYGDELAPSKEAGTMDVLVEAGAAIIAGHFIISDAQESVAIDAGDAQPRIDIVVCESNESAGVRAGRFTVVKGTPGAVPEAPALTNTGGIEQLAIAQIAVPALAANLNSATLTDARVELNGRHTHDYTEIAGLVAALGAKLNSSGYTAADVLTKIKTVDGAGTGLDADLLDGNHAAAFAPAAHTHDDRYFTESEVTAALALKLTAPVSGGAVKFAAAQPSMNVGDIWLKDLGLV